MPIKNRLHDLQDELTALRRSFHMQPELLFDTHQTAAKVAELLRAYGCDQVVEGIGRTGVVGVIKGAKGTQRRAIGLRADMDALPISEATGLDYASTIPGKMHACGHDGHMTMLLGAAKVLCETRNFDGDAVVIFQPAEEGGGGGREMVQDGLMERFGIDEVYGMHNLPGLDVGKMASCPGPVMAAADHFDIHVRGKGGHAAHPHTCIDTTLVSAQIVVAVQSITARVTDPMKPAVVSICAMKNDSEAYNVIAENVWMKGTVRTMDPSTQDLIEDRLSNVVTQTAQSFGAEAELDYRRGYPATINHAAQSEFAAEVIRNVTGGHEAAYPQMGAEDFSYMLNERPGAYVFVGNGPSQTWHHPKFNFNDDAIPIGASYWITLVEQRLMTEK